MPEFWYTRQINLSNLFMSLSDCVSADPKLESVQIVVYGAFANGFLNDSFSFSARDPVQSNPEMARNTGNAAAFDGPNDIKMLFTKISSFDFKLE